MFPLDTFEHTFNHRVEKKEFLKNTIYFNEQIKMPINPKDGLRALIAGDPGSGKSWLLGIIANQMKNMLMFDPTTKFPDILKEMGCEKDWEYLYLTKKNVKNAFKINVSDLHERCIHTMFPRAEDTDKKKKQRQAVERFIEENKYEKKRYQDWSDLCFDYNLDSLKQDMDLILSPDDSAQPILELGQGKKVIDCEGISVRNPSIAVFLMSFLGARNDFPKTYLENPSNFVLFGFDEAQDHCLQDTPMGNGFSTVGGQARKYGMGLILVGAGFDKLHTGIRTNQNFSAVYSSVGLAKKYRESGLPLILDDFVTLEKKKYYCYLFTKNGYFKRTLCLPSLFFKEIRKDVPVRIVEKDETEFNFEFLHPLPL